MAKENILARIFKKRDKNLKKIIVCGHELELKYSLYAATSYERMTGKSALDLAQFQDNKIEPIVILGYCMLLGSNDLEGLGITLESFMNDMDTSEKMTAFIQAVSEELAEFYKPDKQDAGTEGEDAKN